MCCLSSCEHLLFQFGFRIIIKIVFPLSGFSIFVFHIAVISSSGRWREQRRLPTGDRLFLCTDSMSTVFGLPLHMRIYVSLYFFEKKTFGLKKHDFPLFRIWICVIHVHHYWLGNLEDICSNSRFLRN